MSKEKKPLSRWNAGNERYPKDILDAIVRKYREGYGWHQGAKVYRK